MNDTVYEAEVSPKGKRRWPWFLAVAVGVLYLGGMAWTHRIDDDFSFAPSIEDGQSRAVALASALIAREVEQNRWVTNDPFFLPGHYLDNMPNFQQGVIAALSRFAIEMADQIGRTRGSSEVDADLEKAAGLLKYPGDVWLIDPKTSWMPTASSEKQYIAARKALDSYNRRLAAKTATFERRADNLLTTLDRIAKDLGSASALIDHHLRKNGGWSIDTRADNVFFAVKGRLYAYGLLLRDLGQDFSNVIAEKELGPAWEQMLESFHSAAQLDPAIVMGGAPDSQFVPSHLAAQGFYLLRARTQLQEAVAVLQK